jgi:hypothetical protein
MVQLEISVGRLPLEQVFFYLKFKSLCSMNIYGNTLEGSTDSL